MSDLFVFDNLVAVRLDTGGFKFFPIPLVAGTYSNEIPMDECIDEINFDILAYGMR